MPSSRRGTSKTSVEDGGLVAADAAGEGVQVRQVVTFDRGDPGWQVLAVAAGHHLGECGDVAGGGAQLQVAGLDLVELGLLVLGEAVLDPSAVGGVHEAAMPTM